LDHFPKYEGTNERLVKTTKRTNVKISKKDVRIIIESKAITK